MIGQTLNKRYRITARLGEGAMGEVYRATDTQTRQELAIKVITAKLASDTEMLERFRREGEALRQLRHANIVAFVEMFPLGQQHAIVMEYAPGGSLHSLIQRGPLPLDRAVRIALELCDALARAHHLNIIHRDIKSDNVLIAEDGTPRLTDFGVARLVGDQARLTGTGTQIGTPYYMSPEAWEGRPLDPQADIWSLGVMLYEMLTGQVPFGGDTLVAVMNRVLTAPLPDLRTIRPEVPPALVKVVQRMLMRDKAERYETMRQVAVDLEQVEKVARRGQTEETRPKAEEEQPVKALQAQKEAQRKAEEEQRAKALQAQKPAEDARRTGVLVPEPGSAAPRATANASAPGRALALGGLAALAAVCLLAAGGLGLWATGKFLAPTATQTPSPTATVPLPSPTPRPTDTLPPTDTPPPTPLSPTPAPTTLGIGSTLLSEKDGMTLVYVPADKFLMGSTDVDNTAQSNEKPQHTVYLDAFWIDQTEVTNAIYARCVQAGKCQPPSDTKSYTHQNYYGDAQYAQHPVIYVSWNDATAYCAWAGRRLPAEAEWEKAARGADGRIYPWGNTFDGSKVNSCDKNCSYGSADPTVDDGYADIAPVGTYPAGASPYGALDMAGNVWEWANDWYSPDYSGSLSLSNPTGPESGSARVVRGGAWNNNLFLLRASYRLRYSPDFRHFSLGFRCVRSP